MSGASGSSGGGRAADDVEDPFTALTLAPPGAADSRYGNVAPTTGFWDSMRDVIAKEVRGYVTTSFSAAQTSGFR